MNITEFRKDLRNQFNKAITEPVLIERGGLEFELRVKPKGYPGTMESVEVDKSERATELLFSKPALPRESLKTYGEKTPLTPAEKNLPPEFKPRFCKNGHPIPYPRDKCLGKGCKYA